MMELLQIMGVLFPIIIALALIFTFFTVSIIRYIELEKELSEWKKENVGGQK